MKMIKMTLFLLETVAHPHCIFLSTRSESHGKLTVFSMKAMLATMCGGKIVDKLRCEYISEHFTHIKPKIYVQE